MALQERDYSVQGKSSGGGILYTFTIRVTENSVNAQQNTSNLTVKAILTHNYSDTAFAKWGTGVSCTLNGNKIFSDYQQRRCDAGVANVYYTWTGNVEHDSDGTLKLKVGGELWQNNSASYTPQRMTIAENEDTAMDLTPIARESTAVASDAYIGSNTTISVNRGNQNLTHSIRLKFGEISRYIGNDWKLGENEVKLSATSIGFKIPEDFYEQIPTEDSKECKLIITTYSGETKVGEPKDSTFRVMANPAVCSPEVEGTVVDDNPYTFALTGNNKKLVKFFSKALCTIKASGKNSATIRDVQIGNTVLNAGDNTLLIDKVETTSIVFSAIDSRGFRGSYTDENVSLVPYIQLTNQATCKRTDPTSGKAVLTFAGDWFNDSFGKESNSLTLQYQIGGGAVVDVPYSPDNTDRYAAKVTLEGLDYNQSHTITVTVKDKLYTAEKVLVVQKGIPAFDWSENDFAFHVPVTVPQVNGVCMASKYIVGKDIYLRTNLKTWGGSGYNTQSILFFGGSVYGFITADDRGGILWNGTSNVSVIDDSDGVVKITLPFDVTYNFAAISPEPITFL